MQQGRDFSVLENAIKLRPEEYKVHPQLGFISLNSRLADSDVLAVSFEYTVNGESKVYQKRSQRRRLLQAFLYCRSKLFDSLFAEPLWFEV